MPNKSLFICLFTLFLFSLSALSQSLSELEEQKKQLNNKLENSSKLLAKYSKQRQSGLKNINVLNQQIVDREKLISVYKSEIGLIKKDILELKTEIKNTEEKLEELKTQYARLIKETYANKKRYNELSFFFGAKSFNEAYRRYTMLKEYNRFRHNQGILITQKSDELEQSNHLLQAKLKVQNNALNKVNSQYERLLQDKRSVSNNVKNLQQKESSLKKDIRQQKRNLKKLEDTIIKIIAEMSSEKVDDTDFHLAKGKLIWPVDKGVIISHFGEHKHPVLKYVKVNNNGIDIQSSESLEAKSVFAGKVTRIVPIPGYNKAILIRHGRFLTVYANLDKVRVNSGDNVTKNSVIGTIYNGEGKNSGVLHFEIWEESEKLNPVNWLIK
jgi:murein DD-endopeptidase MepM/ murein hydrolase activator NlpD